MDKFERQQAVSEALEMMKASIERPKFKAMIRQRVREALKRKLWDKTLELYSIIEKLSAEDD